MPCVPGYIPFCLRNRKGTPQGTSAWNAFSETPFPNTLSVRKRSVTEGVCTGYQAHVPRYVPFYLADLKKDAPKNFDMKRLIRTAFAEHPNKRLRSPESLILPAWYPGKTIHDPSVARIVHQHLTRGRQARRLPLSWRGQRPKRFMCHLYPFWNPSKTLRKPFRDPFRNPVQETKVLTLAFLALALRHVSGSRIPLYTIMFQGIFSTR